MRTIKSCMIALAGVLTLSGQALATESDDEAPATGSIGTEVKDAFRNNRGRGFAWAFGSAETGIQYLALNTFSSDALLPDDVSSDGVGPLAGLFMGARISLFTLGVRGRMALMPEYRYWNVGPELGVRIPLGDWEPHAALGGGLAGLSGITAGSRFDNEHLQVRGANARLGFGVDYFVSRRFSLSALLAAEAVVLVRKEVVAASVVAADTSDPYSTRAALLAADGSSAGFGSTASLAATLHL